MSNVRKVMMLPVAALAFSLSACGGSASTKSDGGSSVTATQREFSIILNMTTVKSGSVSIKTQNSGKIDHELVVFRTDIPEAALPLGADGKVDEKGTGITHLDPEAEGVAPGKSKSISVDLAPGRYVLVCNLPGHYTGGMHAVLTVT